MQRIKPMKTIAVFVDMVKGHPQHVFLIKDDKHADELFESGRLEDEDVIPAPTTKAAVRKGERDKLLPMKLSRVPLPKAKAISSKPVASAKPATAAAGKVPGAPKIAVTPVAITVGYVVWESNDPSDATSIATGSLLQRVQSVL
jgi:hypothetical protein